MNKKTLLFLAIGVFVAFVIGFGGVWLVLGNNQHHGAKNEAAEKAPQGNKSKQEASLTSTVDLFQLVLPCQRNAEGNTPIVHADFQLVVPIKHRLKIEENTSRVRDIIATLLRNSDINAINSDNLVGLKKQIIQQAHDSLGVEIEEVLVLRFDYDILRQKHPQ